MGRCAVLRNRRSCPFALRRALFLNGVLYVANLTGDASGAPGEVHAFAGNGKFLGKLTRHWVWPAIPVLAYHGTRQWLPSVQVRPGNAAILRLTNITYSTKFMVNNPLKGESDQPDIAGVARFSAVSDGTRSNYYSNVPLDRAPSFAFPSAKVV